MSDAIFRSRIGEISPFVKRDGGDTSVLVAELFVRALLTHFVEFQFSKNSNDLPRTQGRGPAHRLFAVRISSLRSNKFGLENRISVLHQHGDDFFKVFVELIERLRL